MIYRLSSRAEADLAEIWFYSAEQWNLEQALAVYELLNDLAEAIWSRYEIPLRDLLKPDLEQDHAAQHDLFDCNDPIPF